MSNFLKRMMCGKKEKTVVIGSRIRLKNDKTYLGTIVKTKVIENGVLGYVVQWDKYKKGDVYAYPLEKIELI